MKAEVAIKSGEKSFLPADGKAFGGNDGILRPRPAPVIGVLMQPMDENIPTEFTGESPQQLEGEGTSYIAASYVKYIESAGAVAMPIDLDLSEDEHNTLFNQLDGLFLPGGSADLTGWDKPYVRTAKFYYDRAKELYPDNLDRRRILSFKPDAEQSVLFGSGLFSDTKPYNTGLLEPQPVVDLIGAPKDMPVELEALPQEGSLENIGKTEEELEDDDERKAEEGRGSRDLATLRSVFSVDAIKGLLATHPIAYFHHHRHLSLEEFKHDQVLNAEWNLLASATLPREDSLEIVVAVEHKKFPFFGMQFHPEKALYEHCPKTRIPHFFLSTLPTLYISAFIGLISRRSNHTFKDEKEKFSRVAFAFTPTRTAVFGETYNFEQVYFFPPSLRQEMRQRIKELGEKTQQTQQQQPEKFLVKTAADEV